jgi:hypothetical protein
MTESSIARRGVLMGLFSAMFLAPTLATAQTGGTTTPPAGTTTTPGTSPPARTTPGGTTTARRPATPRRTSRYRAGRSWVGRRADDVERGTRPVRRGVGRGVRWVGDGMARGGRWVSRRVRGR